MSTGTLVDSNVILDVVTDDPTWAPWSAGALADAADRGPLVVNPLVFAEVSVGFARIEDARAALAPTAFTWAPLPYDAAFLAGKAFVAYRRAGGTRRSPLPDFYIGAHAAVAGLAVLTRDAERYRSYFPHVPVTAPPAQAP